MIFLYPGGARALKSRLSGCWPDSRDRRSAERMRPFLSLLKLCGTFANEIDNGRLKRCPRPFYGVCVFWISAYVSYVCFLLYKYLTVDAITVRITVDFAKHFIGFAGLGVNVIAAYTSQNHFVKFFDRMDSYDYEVARMNHERRDNLRIPWIATLSITIILLLLVSVMVCKADLLVFVMYADIFTMIMQILGTMGMFVLLHLMLERFRHINDKIVPNLTWDGKQGGSITISDLKMLDSMLRDAWRAFNDIYENTLLMCFASLMLHVLANIRTFREKTPLIACTFVGPPIMQLLILCAICHYTAEEANRTPCVLCGYTSALGNAGNTMTKIDILTYFLHNRVSFEAAGYFTINLPLFQSIIAAITTYFIILI